MITVYKMNPEAYAYDSITGGEKVFRGNTLEEFLENVKEYFSAEYEYDTEAMEIILGQAKECYKKKINEYVYFNYNSLEDNYFLTYEEAYEYELDNYMNAWYEMNRYNLYDKFNDKLENIDLEEMLIGFILNDFNGYNKYKLEFKGYERGRSYWNTIEIKDYDVNEKYSESEDNFLEQVYTGTNVFGNYVKFYDNLIEKLQEVIESKKHEIYEEFCKDNLEADYFFAYFDEEMQEDITEFICSIDEKIDWEDIKQYVK